MKRSRRNEIALALVFAALCCTALAQAPPGEALAGTELLDFLADDPAAQMVAGIDRFALRQIDQAKTHRTLHWDELLANREQSMLYLKTSLGLPVKRGPKADSGLLFQRPSLVHTKSMAVDAIRWSVGSNPAPQLRAATSLWGEGVMIQPVQANKRLAIVLPDADESPEDYLGMTDRNQDCSQQKQLVRQLVSRGFTVVIPQLIGRTIMQHGHARLSQREYLHRAAFELGHTLVGYEVEMIQFLLDEFSDQPTVVFGFGEGGMLALFCAAVDERIAATACCGYFGPRESMWRGPLSRNIFGLLERFGDAELAAMIAPRKLFISSLPNYQVHLEGSGGAPADWASPKREEVQAEFARLLSFLSTHLPKDVGFADLLETDATDAFLSQQLMDAIALELQLPAAAIETDLGDALCEFEPEAQDRASQRGQRLLATVDAHSQAILNESEYVRTNFMNIGLPRNDLPDRSNALESDSTQAYEDAQARFRKIFSEQIIGKFDEPLLPPSPKTQRKYAGNGWIGYDVVLDVFPDVFAYGVLLLPDDLTAMERRPVVVCQHGLEGRPQDVIAGDHPAYHDFAAKLAERGFIVFAPQNPYIGKDQFRTLQRKMNPIGKSLFSIIGPQHEQLIRWLSTLPNVDSSRIAFYGLSYGGKSAMRLPALLPQYCLSICSADFNDWVWKNASSRSPYSYLGTGEYEIFEFNLAHTFNYAEMAALIAPRPFMVERGHFDGVAPDDRVAKEFARVRFLYAARLGLPDRCEIEWFNGPHTINGQGTFRFLHQHLNWPVKKAAEN